MNLKDIDFTKKENQTFKNWFRIMWSNGYIFLFLVGLGFLIGFIPSFDPTEFASYVALAIPTASISAIAYKAFYQFWDDLKKGTSR
jgi:hypothetical protein